MAKFCGLIGYVDTPETAPGVYSEVVTTRKYFGDVIRNTRRWEAGQNQNDNLNVSNTISIVSDAYADQNFHAMRFIQWMGAFWEITTVEVQRPRLILTIGGVYNGNTDPTPEPA